MKIILVIFRFFLSLRYKIIIKGSKELKHDGPILLLPNHVALIDPQILISFLYKYIKVSPVASEKYYNQTGINTIMKFFGTIPIGDFEAGGEAEKIKASFNEIVKGLEEGKNILIYPSGQIYRQGFESIIGKQSVYNIVNLMPKNTKVLGIKDKGLWGSMWSMAWDNGKTSFGKLALKSIWLIFANLRFFIPKRNVNIYIEDITEQINIYKKMSLLEFNGYLENFYNKEGEEDINYIKHYFYYNDIKDKLEPTIITGSLKEIENTKDHNISNINIELKNDIKNKISLIKEIDITKVGDNSNLIIDLYFDSLDISEIKAYIQSNFHGASNPPITELKTVADLYIMSIGQSLNVEELKECEWQEIKEETNLLIKKI